MNETKKAVITVLRPDGAASLRLFYRLRPLPGPPGGDGGRQGRGYGEGMSFLLPSKGLEEIGRAHV